MDKTKYLIIGGGPAGISAAQIIASKDPGAKVLIVEKGPSAPYMRLDLSKGFMWGEIPQEKIFFGTPDQLVQMGIEISLNEEALSLDVQNRVLTTNKRRIKFEKALICTGSSPRRAPIPGSDLKNVFYLRSLEDAEGIKEALSSAKSVVLIGGGLISFELSYAFSKLGLSSTILIRESYLWEGKVEEDLGRMFQKTLEETGVGVLPQTEVAEILGSAPLRQGFAGQVAGVRLKDGRDVAADLVVIGVGVFPNLEFLKDSGIEVEKGIICDQYLQTNIPGIFAAGDAAEFYDVVLKKRHLIGHWNNAIWQGQLAGANMTAPSVALAKEGDGLKEYRKVTSYDTKVFDLSLSFLGDPEGYDQREVEGEIGDKKAKVIYRRGQKPIGAVLINQESKKEVEDLILKG